MEVCLPKDSRVLKDGCYLKRASVILHKDEHKGNRVGVGSQFLESAISIFCSHSPGSHFITFLMLVTSRHQV